MKKSVLKNRGVMKKSVLKNRGLINKNYVTFKVYCRPMAYADATVLYNYILDRPLQ